MDHKNGVNKLNRKADERKALVNALLTELFRYQRIRTTLPKAKALKRHADKIITQAKRGQLHNRRNVQKKIQSKEVVTNLFENIAPRFSERPGGYTRILKLQSRLGDNAKMAYLELVDIPDYKKLDEKKKAKKKPLSRTAKKPVYPGKKKAGEKKPAQKEKAVQAKE